MLYKIIAFDDTKFILPLEYSAGEKIATFLLNLRNHPCNTFVVSKLLPIAFFSLKF